MHNKARNRGLAFVEMGSEEEAAQALAKLEAFEYEGRTLRLAYATPKKTKASPLAQPKPPVVYNLFVANLSYLTRSRDLKEFFQSGGSEVVKAEVVFNENPRKSSGYGFVSFKTKKEADDALIAFDGKELMERPIRLARSNRFVKLESELNSVPEDGEDDSSHDSEQTEAVDSL
uniref:RRM domain-containing protein n=2 Tax=Chenopodium quinoa TaxID=63459 RepID=A0A803MEC6_CHEQI